MYRGIIPACAGNTKARNTACRIYRDHPRVCGEHRYSKAELSRCLGSSPRVRGTRRDVLRASRDKGIIPACAGNTSAVTCVSSFFRDHPRVCGEHSVAKVHTPPRSGSSPRVRGTPIADSSETTSSRIIPACAGNTFERKITAIVTRDHPRVCGEHSFLIPYRHFKEGSSPRVRGTLQRLIDAGIASGIIPACAGNTRTSLTSRFAARDHPRVCGEHLQAVSQQRAMEGSSPRVRGTPYLNHCIIPHMGIIPACAGNTPFCVGAVYGNRDHPRVCGEHNNLRKRKSC